MKIRRHKFITIGSKPALLMTSNPCNDAFSFTELFVVIAALAVLALIVFPVFAGVQNKGGRFQCENNLRQIGMESMIYASDNKGWLPLCTLGAANANGKANYLGGLHYSAYVFDGEVNTFVSTNVPPPMGWGFGFQNLGYLYHAGLAGNGNIFYCPAEWGGPYGANSYSPLLTTDSTGSVRSSYFYNPRMLNAFSDNYLRRYQTTSQLEPHRLFAVDSIVPGITNNELTMAPGVNPASIEHARDHGWNVLFTDGSVQFSRLAENNDYFFDLVTTELVENESEESYEQYDQVFDFLEQDH